MATTDSTSEVPTSDVTPPFIVLPDPAGVAASTGWVDRARRGLSARHRQRAWAGRQIAGLLIIAVLAVIAASIALHFKTVQTSTSDAASGAPSRTGIGTGPTGGAGTGGTGAPTAQGLAASTQGSSPSATAAATPSQSPSAAASPSPSAHASTAKSTKKPAASRKAKPTGTAHSSSQTGKAVLPTAGVYYEVVNNHSGAVLDATNCGTSPGTRVNQWSSLGNTCQRWSFTQRSDGYYTITNQNSGLALDAFNCGTGNGTMTDTWTPLGNQCQEWSLVANGSHFIIANRFSHLVLDDTDCSVENGAPINTWSTLGNACQEWTLKK